MLEIILFILKLIGILLLIVLGLVVVLLFLILFAPVKYSSTGSKYGEEINIRALFTYLNPLVRIQVHYHDETIVQAKILFFTIYPKKSKASKTAVVEESVKDRTFADTVKKEEAGSTLDTIGSYASLLKENKGLILDVLKTILKALKTILPRKCYVKAVFGTGQADTTGFIYGAYCSMQEYLPGKVILEPVWIEAKAEGEYSVKGKIRLIHFAIAITKLITDKNVRLLYKKLRRV